MVKLKKYLRSVLVFIIIIYLLGGVSLAIGEDKNRIFDFADLLNKEEKQDLEVLAKKYSKKRETDFIILTISEPGGVDIVDYVEDFYDEKGLGYDKTHGNVAILTIDMENRDIYLAGFYEAEKYLDDHRLDKIRNRIGPALSSGNYYDAFRDFLNTANRYMGVRPGVNPDNILFNLYFQILASLILAGGIVGALAYNSGGKSGAYAASYEDYDNTRIISRHDTFIRSSVSRRKKPSDKSSGGGSSFGGGGGVTKGGHSHSGSRGKF